MAKGGKCGFPECGAKLRRGYLACQRHWFSLEPTERAHALKLYVHDRDRQAAKIYISDRFEQMKGSQPCP